MKKIYVSAASLAAFFILMNIAAFNTGCVTTGSGPINTNQLYKGAAILKMTVSASVVVATEKDTNAITYIRLIGGVLDAVISGTDYTPGTLSKAITALNIKQLQTPEARIAINTALGLYEIYYGDYVSGKINSNQTALVLLQAIKDGINQGLGPSPP